ncbi:kinesin-domain-containing protein [Fistulina hepatica ATCC 64428]|uniref:Kinesin-like protein n=1 Tax=Fistulina hepatica ATCC 64428 TaxID=1128425 RepID=A0A0D7A8I9_9AGAR|nr:kinesin-domain-containing protein [Fistulina hepatica ATCC 64428]
MSTSASSNSGLFRTGRPAPFTPTKRPLSAAGSTPAARNHTTPGLLSSTHKYKAPLSSESKLRTGVKPLNLSFIHGTPSRPGSPMKADARPRTPATPHADLSEMDVTQVDPEEVLVDFQSVEPGDISGELDIHDISDANLRSQDKVMLEVFFVVSLIERRIRPTTSQSAWEAPVLSSAEQTIKLDPTYARTSTTPAHEFTFDSVLNGELNKPIYSSVARSHVYAAMEGFNAVVFAYGQTASGKTYTLSGTPDQPGIIPRAMRDIFGFIKRMPTREYLLRCSYLEIYNETIVDLLAPPSTSGTNVVHIQSANNAEVILAPLREEVVTSFKTVQDVLRRGEGNRRTATTDWNEHSSRSHSVFRVVIESRERGDRRDADADDFSNGRQTPSHSTCAAGGAHSGRQTPGLSGRTTPGLGGRRGHGPKLQGKCVQTSVLNLIDLAGSERATSDKDRTREGRYINTSLLTLGSVIGTLAENAVRGKNDHVRYRDSKLTRMLQPCLAGNARISVICTINPEPSAVAESLSTLGFAKRIKGVKLNAQKKEVVDTDALIARYQKEIEELKSRLAEREREAPVLTRRLSAREKIDESKAMRDLNSRIQQLTKLILTSQTVEDIPGDASRPASPTKVDFDMSPYQLQQELLAAHTQLESQATQILSLEAVLVAQGQGGPASLSESDSTSTLVDSDSSSESDKDRIIAEQAKKINELETAVREANQQGPMTNFAEKEQEWAAKLAEEKSKREEKERWADELVKQLDKERKTRILLEDQRRALAAFVSKFDAMTTVPFSKLPTPTPGGAAAMFTARRNERREVAQNDTIEETPEHRETSPARPTATGASIPEEWCLLAADESFEMEMQKVGRQETGLSRGKELKLFKGKADMIRGVFGAKENLPVTKSL